MLSAGQKPASGPDATKRRCLKCRQWFASEWNGNRICHGCNKRNESADSPARCEFLGVCQSEDSIARQVKMTNHETGVE